MALNGFLFNGASTIPKPSEAKQETIDSASGIPIKYWRTTDLPSPYPTPAEFSYAYDILKHAFPGWHEEANAWNKRYNKPPR